MERLPLFPLNTVLFPGVPLPLHIFEERYKLMIGRCIDDKAPFGVVLIRSGPEVGGAAEPHDIGASARIARVQRLPDGRMNLVALGERRFRILALDTTEPFLAGDVDYLESEDGEGAEASDLAANAAALFGEQFRLSLCAAGEWQRRLDLPTDPDLLADFIASQMEATAQAKQELLEVLSVPERLRKECELLGDRVRQLTEAWEETRRKKFAGSALN